MTYKKLFDLKYNQGISTYELVQRFPNDIRRVSEVALSDIPEETLLEVLQEKSLLAKVRSLKKKYLKG